MPIRTYLVPAFLLGAAIAWAQADTNKGSALYDGPWGLTFATVMTFRGGLPIDATTGDDSSEILAGLDSNASSVLAVTGCCRALEFHFCGTRCEIEPTRAWTLRVMNAFRLGETARLQLSGEMFNVFNFDNIAFFRSGRSGHDLPAWVPIPGPVGLAARPLSRY